MIRDQKSGITRTSNGRWTLFSSSGSKSRCPWSPFACRCAQPTHLHQRDIDHRGAAERRSTRLRRAGRQPRDARRGSVLGTREIAAFGRRRRGILALLELAREQHFSRALRPDEHVTGRNVPVDFTTMIPGVHRSSPWLGVIRHLRGPCHTCHAVPRPAVTAGAGLAQVSFEQPTPGISIEVLSVSRNSALRWRSTTSRSVSNPEWYLPSSDPMCGKDDVGAGAHHPPQTRRRSRHGRWLRRAKGRAGDPHDDRVAGQYATVDELLTVVRTSNWSDCSITSKGRSTTSRPGSP